MSPPRVLLLTSGLGGGHTRAAEAIERALMRQQPASNVQVLDWWSLINPSVARSAQAMYLNFVQQHPDLHEEIYRFDCADWRTLFLRAAPPPVPVRRLSNLLTTFYGAQPETAAAASDEFRSDRALFSMFFSMFCRPCARWALIQWSWSRIVNRLARSLCTFRPQVIVSTQMIPAALVARAQQRAGLRIPSIAVATDFGMHRFWTQAGADLYCVGHEDIGALPPGLGAERVVATGIPLMDHFSHPTQRSAARRLLGLSLSAPVVAVLGGSLGLGVEAMTRSLLQARGHPQLLVLIGRQWCIPAALDAYARQHPQRLQFVSWTDRVDLFLRAADLVVAKPGGLTVAEVLACGRPLLATQSLGGQETFNGNFIEKHGAGVLVRDRNIAAVTDALLATPRQLQTLGACAWQLGRRNGAQRIAEIIVERALAPRGAIPSRRARVQQGTALWAPSGFSRSLS